MRHRKRSVKFGRQTSHYKATMHHLVRGLVINKSISTTKVKAKAASRLADKLVTLGKMGTVASRRRAYSILQDRDLVAILFNDIAPLFKDRKGGYTRIMLTNRRNGDNAQMSILEFVEKPEKAFKKEVKKEEKKKPKPIKEEPRPHLKEKEVPIDEPIKEPAKPKEESRKPGFFRKIFGRKKD